MVAGLVGGFDWLVASIVAVMKSVFVNIGHIVWWTRATVQSSGSQDVVREEDQVSGLGPDTGHPGPSLKGGGQCPNRRIPLCSCFLI